MQESLGLQEVPAKSGIWLITVELGPLYTLNNNRIGVCIYTP